MAAHELLVSGAAFDLDDVGDGGVGVVGRRGAVVLGQVEADARHQAALRRFLRGDAGAERQ